MVTDNYGPSKLTKLYNAWARAFGKRNADRVMTRAQVAIYMANINNEAIEYVSPGVTIVGPHSDPVVGVDPASGQDVSVAYGASATGGLDDLEAYYSGKSGANPDDELMKGEVRKTYRNGVRPDHMMFASIAREKALAMKPRILCPNCEQPVIELASAVPSFVPPKTVDVVPQMLYHLHPCGCRVHSEWAAAFAKEMQRRIDGEVPLLVAPFTPKELGVRVKALEIHQTALLLARDNTTSQEERAELEYKLVACTDELMRLIPGTHNSKIKADLSPEVAAWADKNKLHSIQPKSSVFGYASSYPMPKFKVNEKAARDDVADSMASLKMAFDSGIISAEAFKSELQGEWKVWEPPEPSKNSNLLGHADPAVFPGLQTLPVGQPKVAPKVGTIGLDKAGFKTTDIIGIIEFVNTHEVLVYGIVKSLFPACNSESVVLHTLAGIMKCLTEHVASGTPIPYEGMMLLKAVKGYWETASKAPAAPAQAQAEVELAPEGVRRHIVKKFK